MSNVIDMWKWRQGRSSTFVRPRLGRRREDNGGFVRIGDVSSAVVRKLRE